ncbi:hypothetical protein [Streptacidiphilus sp. EB103A]|uniref:hypothetical protein n=1 Tax=Streptacidiphilus sp. EB103A TaxID=3156275 RepID=UPI0035126C2A
MVLAWRDVVEGTFEVRSVRDGVLQAHNLIDDLPYRIRSNAGSDALRPLRPGTFVITRIVPLADDWMNCAPTTCTVASRLSPPWTPNTPP